MSPNPHEIDCGQPVLTPAEPRLELAVMGSEGRKACETAQAVTLIGSRRDCHLPINDPDVSKLHCAVVHTGSGFLACDLCSRAGTTVNGAVVRVTPLRAGDRLRVGPIDVQVSSHGPADGPPTTPARSGAGAAHLLALRTDGPTLHLVRDPEAIGTGMVDLTSSAALIGRRSTCDVVADTPDVSLVHALIFTYHGRPVVADLGSRSGTLLNGQRVQMAWLGHGDELNIGGRTLRVCCDGAGEATASATTHVPVAAALPQVPIAYPPKPSMPDANAVDELMQAVLGDLTAARARLDERAAEADKRQAEIDTLAALLNLQSEQLERKKTELAKRESQVEQALAEASRRLEEAVAREQAVAAAWAELDRWFAAWDSSRRAMTATEGEGRPAPRPAAGLGGLPDAPPIARPFPPLPGPASGPATNV
ncbi:MAG: FHA domain-containing protein [Planctomycetota bacterium]